MGDKRFLACIGHSQRSNIFMILEAQLGRKEYSNSEHRMYTESIKVFLKQVISFQNLLLQHFLFKTYCFIFSLRSHHFRLISYYMKHYLEGPTRETVA